MKTIIILFFMLFGLITCAQTPKQIVLHNSPIRIDTGYVFVNKNNTYKKYEGINYVYKMFRIYILTENDSVIVMAGKKRSLYISPNDRKEVLNKLKK